MIYDEHTLYLTHNKLSDQVLHEQLDQIISGPFYLNNIHDRDGEPIGVSFVFLERSNEYHKLLGRNPDGSTRTEEEVISGGTSDCWADEMELQVTKVKMLPPLIKIPDGIRISAAFVEEPDPNFQRNVLYITGIDGLERSQLRELFGRYSSRRDYPEILINQTSQTAIVRYERRTDDALFALHMSKKIMYQGRRLTAKLAFNRSTEGGKNPVKHRRPQ